jgi:hypothetical protein
MGVSANIRIALDTKLAAMSGSYVIHYENTKDIPVHGTVNLHSKTVFARALLRDVESKQEYPGFYRIIIRTPVNKGHKNLTDCMGIIASHFRVNTLTAGSSTVYIRAISEGSESERDDAWYIGTMYIYFTCYE